MLKLNLEQGSNEDAIAFLNRAKKELMAMLPCEIQPVDTVLRIPFEKVFPNEYNPNIVAKNEMRLLYTSVKQDGYTQPVVTIYDAEQDRYIIVDGFHRYSVMKFHKDIYEANDGLLPVVVIDTDINQRMASTIRHNRARGKHQISGMADIIFEMLQNGWDDKDICNEIGMEPEELIKLKHITGFSKLFENVEYSKAWKTDKQMKIEKEWKDAHADDKATD